MGYQAFPPQAVRDRVPRICSILRWLSSPQRIHSVLNPNTAVQSVVYAQETEDQQNRASGDRALAGETIRHSGDRAGPQSEFGKYFGRVEEESYEGEI